MAPVLGVRLSAPRGDVTKLRPINKEIPLLRPDVDPSGNATPCRNTRSYPAPRRASMQDFSLEKGEPLEHIYGDVCPACFALS
jgi:hypothetical protein